MLQELVDNDRISVSFKKNIRDYAKYKISLRAGEKLRVPKPSSNIRLKLIDSLGKDVVTSIGLALIYQAEKTEEYYLFIDNRIGWGGSYSGTVSIDAAALPRSKKQSTHKTYDKADIAMPE